jgi:hypothetical protein
VLGATCGVNASVAVVGAVQGPLDDPQQGATGVVVDDPDQRFSVPALVPSANCPAGLTSAGNTLLGLPTPPGEAHLKILVKVTAYIRL